MRDKETGQFQKGTSGNPNGRPKNVKVSEPFDWDGRSYSEAAKQITMEALRGERPLHEARKMIELLRVYERILNA